MIFSLKSSLSFRYGVTVSKVPYKKRRISKVPYKNAITNLSVMFNHDLDRNYDFRKLLGTQVKTLIIKDVIPGFGHENNCIDNLVKIKTFSVVSRPNEGAHRVQRQIMDKNRSSKQSK